MYFHLHLLYLLLNLKHKIMSSPRFRFMPSPAFKAIIVKNIDDEIEKAKIQLSKVEAEVKEGKYEEASVYCSYLFDSISKLKDELDGLPNN